MPCILFAQTVTGIVTDALTHEPLPGVSVSTETSSQGAITDQHGKFHIQSAKILHFSMVGYTSQAIEVKSATGIHAALQPSSLDLQPVVVSASREKQLRHDAPVAITKISQTQIQDTKATALYQLLNKVSGVYMVDLGNEQHTMAIRQPITYNALYLYMEDGLPIRPTGIFNHNSLYEINMSGVKDIEVIKGPASSLYGSNAIGGAINFISQGPPTGYAGNFAVQGDNYHYRRVDASGGFTAGKFGFYAGGYLTDQNNAWQDYSNYNKYSGNLKSTYDFTNNTRLTASASYNYLNTQTPGSLDYNHFISRSYGSNQRFTYRKVDALRSSVRLDHTWSQASSTFITAFYRHNSTAQLPSYFIADVRNSAGQYLSSNGQVNDQRFHSFGVLAQHRTDFDFLHSRLIAGVYIDDSPSSFYAQALSIQKDVANNFYTGYSNTGQYLDDYRIKLFNTAAYTQYEIKPWEPLRIVAGLRYDRVHYDFINGLPPSNTKYKQQETNNFDVLAPKIGFTYNINANTGFYGNYSVGFQPPETSSLYSSRQLAPLKEATFNNYELGGWLTGWQHKFYMEASLFDLEGKNEIISQLLPDNTTQNLNAGATRHLGVEYTLLLAPVQQLSFRFSGTNARHTYVDYSEVRTGKTGSYTIVYNGNRMSNAPAWIANSEITWKPSFIPGFRIAPEWQHIDKYYTDPGNTKTYNGYDIFNLRTGYQFKTLALKGVSVWLNVLNLTNKLYATTVTSNQYGDTYNAAPPRIYTIGLSYNFSKY
ncbi:TonB-dependent receptor [Mucilaginibacter sp. RS28]|uniref:TonB-dependent receptor n=1 Tax=Mucilaginibacter straminoryzae TaxID=2932774 RepID=A0A9X1X5K1_9SPHI|nr:TonB-dependent receptor [Mucilaginibacter straminoryzae]MCJ8210966.1 TonB-dependent receptor [Mucilaginibacter straminoryzae]